MKEIDRIIALLGHDALERRVAAAIVLGELEAKGSAVVDGLVGLLGSGVPVLQKHACDALARVGAKRALGALLPLATNHAAEVRDAAIRAIASVGEEALPWLRERLGEASPEEKRAIDVVLAEIGGRDAFGELLKGLVSSDAEAAKAAALAVRQQVKGADARQRKTYATATLKFLEALEKKGASPAALAALLKILGFLEDERAAPALLRFASDPAAAPLVRMEALLALRFALAEATGEVVDALVSAAGAPDRVLAQAALHTLGGLALDKDAIRRMVPLVTHLDADRAVFAIEHLARQRAPEATAMLARGLAHRDKRVSDAATTALGQREDAAPTLTRVLLETESADRAWALRGVLRPLAKKIPPALRKELVAAALEHVKQKDRGYEAFLDVAREAEPDGIAQGLRELAGKVRKKDPDKAAHVLGLLVKSERATDEDRFALARLALAKSHLDTAPAARAGDEALRLFALLEERGFDVGRALKKDKDLEPEQLYFVGFHFAEAKSALGEELLGEVVARAGRTKVGKMAKNKLALGKPG